MTENAQNNGNFDTWRTPENVGETITPPNWDFSFNWDVLPAGWDTLPAPDFVNLPDNWADVPINWETLPRDWNIEL